MTLTPVLAQSSEPAPSLEVRVLDSSAPDWLAVQVTDTTGQRVPEATVVVRLPEGALFSDSTGAATVQTDVNGIAQLRGIHWGPGGTVRITANKGNSHAGLLIEKSAASAPEPAPVSPVPAKQDTVQQPVVAPPAMPVEKKSPQPGVIVRNDDSPYANVPIRADVAGAEGGFIPKMSIISSGNSSSDHHLRNRILIGVAVAAGAGAAIFLTRNLHSSSSSSSVSVGPPSVSVGQP